MKNSAVLLDTSFFLRLLNEDDPLFDNTMGYYRFFLQKNIDMLISTISIAEYCVRGEITQLPLRDVQVIPFNLSHAKRAGEFARIIFEKRKNKSFEVCHRNLIPNDTKLFSQADLERKVQYYLSSDSSSFKMYSALRENHANPLFQFVDLNTPHNEFFGLLDL